VATVLLVEDRDSLRRMLTRALESEGHTVVAEADLGPAKTRVDAQPFDLVLTDLMLPGGSGLELVAEAKRVRAELPVVVLTGFGTVASAVRAMKLGAADFLEKPVDLDALSKLVHSLVADEPPEPVFAVPGVAPIVGRHPRFKAALRLLERVAPAPTTVLLTGESGTGKELFARALHALSPRAQGPFVAVNCAAIPETLVETEKGAFTGADRRRAGRFEQARHGTLFLDEVGELPPAVQAKVLRVLDGGGYERVGGGESLAADVRIVAASNRDLAEMSAAGRFRSDLLFRLEVFPIELPSLAERPGDVPLLARHLASSLALRHKVVAPEFSEEALSALSERPWPGNVRQLGNAVERAVILFPGQRLGRAEIAQLVETGAAGDPRGEGRGDAPSAEGDDERARIRAALETADGDKREAARLLGLSYRRLLGRVKELDLEGYPAYRD
jgi:DNA-binding NtrC family response regulator